MSDNGATSSDHEFAVVQRTHCMKFCRPNVRPSSGEAVYEGEDVPAIPSCGPDQEEATPKLPGPSLQSASGQNKHSGQDIAPIKAMLYRLEHRGVHVAESMQLNLHEDQSMVDREDALIKAFNALDVDGAERLSTQQLRGLVCLDSQEVNQQQVSDDVSQQRQTR